MRSIWVISFSKIDPDFALTNDFYASKIEGEIIIGKTDYDIKKISANIESAKHSFHGRSLGIKDNNQRILKNVSYTFSAEYKNLILQSIDLQKTFTFKGQSIQESSSIIINNTEVSNVEVIKGRDYFAE